jgi:hypothetical protein
MALINCAAYGIYQKTSGDVVVFPPTITMAAKVAFIDVVIYNHMFIFVTLMSGICMAEI